MTGYMNTGDSYPWGAHVSETVVSEGLEGELNNNDVGVHTLYAGAIPITRTAVLDQIYDGVSGSPGPGYLGLNPDIPPSGIDSVGWFDYLTMAPPPYWDVMNFGFIHPPRGYTGVIQTARVGQIYDNVFAMPSPDQLYTVLDIPPSATSDLSNKPPGQDQSQWVAFDELQSQHIPDADDQDIVEIPIRHCYTPETGHNTAKDDFITSPNSKSTRGSRKRVKCLRVEPQVLDKPPREVIFLDDTGKHAGLMHTFGGTQRVRAAFDPKTRALTARTRTLGACAKCHKGKRRCQWLGDSKYEPCSACKGLVTRSRLLQMPCFRAKIIEVDLFRRGPSKDNPLYTCWSRKEVYALEDDGTDMMEPPRKLHLTQGMGVALTISVARFTPGPRDKTGYTWKDGGLLHTMEMPHFFITNMAEAKASMNSYIQLSMNNYIESILQSSDRVLWDTFSFATRVTSSKPMVQRALKLWAASRVIELDWTICGEDMLDLEVNMDPRNPWHGTIPVTPIMDTQLDQIAIQGVLSPLRDNLLQELENKIYENKKENWFEIYLTIFILLSNTGFILAHSNKFAKRYGMGGRYGYPGQYSSSEGFFHAAKTMLAHFHFAKGSIPLSLGCELAKEGNLNAEQIQYVSNVKEQIRKKGKYIEELLSKHKYEDNLYWCHQMFLQEWKPGQSGIKEET